MIFSHEQSLMISEGENKILIAGCSHVGIVNIKRTAESMIGDRLTHVIGGFHLYNPMSGKQESDTLVQKIAERLKDDVTCYYTCHCTGQKAFDVMKDVLADRLSYLATGTVLEL